MHEKRSPLHISEENLSNNIGKIEDLAEEEPVGIEVVVVHVDVKVIDEHLLALLLGIVVNNGRVKLHHKHFHLAGLPHLPEVTGDVEHDRLVEGNKKIVRRMLENIWLSKRIYNMPAIWCTISCRLRI